MNTKQLKPLLHNIDNSYGIIFKYHGFNGLLNKIHYKSSVSYIKNSYMSYDVSINRGKIYLNNKGSDLIIEKIAEKAGESLFPLSLVVSSNNEIKKLNNFNNIKSKWSNSREEILQYYKSTSIDRMIQLMDIAYNHPSHITQIINKNLFLCLYFYPIYTNTNQDYNISLYPFIAPFCYSIKKTNQYKGRSGKTIIKLEGICTDKRTIKDIEDKNSVILSDSNELSGKLNLTYKFNENNNTIFSIVGDIILYRYEKEIRKIEVEIYNINK